MLCLSFELMIVLHSLAVRSVMLEEQEEENGMDIKIVGCSSSFFFLHFWGVGWGWGVGRHEFRTTMNVNFCGDNYYLTY